MSQPIFSRLTSDAVKVEETIKSCITPIQLESSARFLDIFLDSWMKIVAKDSDFQGQLALKLSSHHKNLKSVLRIQKQKIGTFSNDEI